MTQKIPISVFIIAQNEADRIPPAIRSVIDWVDEVIVIDGGSEDDTVEVSENLGARVEYKKWEGYGPQKAYGESLCRNQWILNVDADEEITDSLRDEIIALFTDGTPRYSAYKLPILPMYGFQSKGHAWTAHCKPVRLFDKNVCCFKSGFVHDSVIVPKGVDVGTFRGVVNHKSFLTMLILPFFAFWKSYLLRREFVNGIDGVLTSHMYAFQRFIRYAKLREREYKKRDEQ
jgi:glycosyltransferase involved in cell wall biosynthesis